MSCAAGSTDGRIEMNVVRLFLAALAAFVAYFVIGFLVFGLSPLRDEFLTAH